METLDSYFGEEVRSSLADFTVITFKRENDYGRGKLKISFLIIFLSVVEIMWAF